MILETFPDPTDFYKTYWGKKPFIVRNFIPPTVIESLVDGDTLAGLALEEDIKSRIIINNEAGNEWACEHGPFDDNRFDSLGEANWSLLVQNVEQYHTDTAELLKYFQFSPRWLMDDIMVSFSAPGGSVGPHTDSYHTFLVQGMGKRTWKISPTRVDDDRYADNPDVKVLQYGFEGETFEVTAGDVIYMPPFFGHEGKTLEAAMTFSVGFLGPKLSEMLGEYAHYLEANEPLDKRYLGETLSTESAAFTLGTTTQNTVRDDVVASVQSDHFARWMATYFSMPTHDDVDHIEPRDEDEVLSNDSLLAALHDGQVLMRPDHVKLVITPAPVDGFHLAVYGAVLDIPATQKPLLDRLNSCQPLTLDDIEHSDDQSATLTLLTSLYNQNILSLDAHGG